MCVSHRLCVLSVCAIVVQCVRKALSVSGACYECVTRVSRVLCVLSVLSVCAMGVQCVCRALSVSSACNECVTCVSHVLCVLSVCVQWLCSACAGH